MRNTNIKEYSKGITEMSNWRSTITIRPSYKLKPHTSDRLVERISKRLRVRIFYTMERDRNDEVYHPFPVRWVWRFQSTFLGKIVLSQHLLFHSCSV